MARRSAPPAPEFATFIAFEKIVPQENCYRRYEIEIVTEGLLWFVITRRGRIGKKLRPLEDVCGSEADARALAARHARRRLLHSYGVVSKN